jgi:uncharacterized protein DUF6184
VNIALKSGLSCVGAVAFALLGCSNNQRPAESASALAEEQQTESGSAIESLAEARCARESRCDNIGADKRYSSMEDCVARIREDWRADLDARACPSGINRPQLDECLNEVRAEECSSPFDTLERVAACTASQICID